MGPTRNVCDVPEEEASTLGEKVDPNVGPG